MFWSQLLSWIWILRQLEYLYSKWFEAEYRAGLEFRASSTINIQIILKPNFELYWISSLIEDRYTICFRAEFLKPNFELDFDIQNVLKTKFEVDFNSKLPEYRYSKCFDADFKLEFNFESPRKWIFNFLLKPNIELALNFEPEQRSIFKIEPARRLIFKLF